MKGKIIKGIAGFYYVHTVESGIYACKAKGIFRNRNIKPLVGDTVEIEILHEKDKEGSLIEIYPRKNELIRPAVSNIDQAILIFAVTEPDPNFNLLDRMLVVMRFWEIPAVICLNKADLLPQEDLDRMAGIYRDCGAPVIFTSAKKEEGIEKLSKLLQEKTSAVAGPSGAGKSSLINLLQQEIEMETGDVSKKIGRGKHTTRYSMLIHVSKDTYIMDTPGFGSLDLPQFTADDLWKQYHEFLPFEPYCRFRSCSHMNEPDCGIRQAVEKGQIHRQRYETYTSLYQELKEMRKYEGRKL
ncbi:MAG: ribosome small subunit-dependent GTPase A [Eubacterium sp.]|nr:ribosome small subunit-dependent GTPase A [Eubacterium sp.]